MPPTVEPGHKRVVQAVVDSLADITEGGVYWHTTGKVDRAPHFHRGHISDKSVGEGLAFYVVSPDEDAEQSDTFTDYATSVELDVTAFRKFEPATEAAFADSNGEREDIQARLAADVKNRLRADEGRAGVSGSGIDAMRVWIPLARFAAEETLFAGWAVVMLRVVIDFTHERETA